MLWVNHTHTSLLLAVAATLEDDALRRIWLVLLVNRIHSLLIFIFSWDSLLIIERSNKNSNIL